MILRSICIWAAVSFVWFFLMNSIVSRESTHKRKLAEIKREIIEVNVEYRRAKNRKSALFQKRQVLSKKIEYEIQRGKSTKLLVAATVETETPPTKKTSSAHIEKVVAKQIFWDQTPAEQELKVGDWITIEGYQDTFIGASIRVENGVNYGLEWKGSNIIDITSQPTAFSAPGDGIHYIIGSIEDPRENEIVVRINEALLREETVLIRVTGQIYQILPPHEMDRYPNQWGVILTEDVYVEFME